MPSPARTAPTRLGFTSDHDLFRSAVRRFVEREVAPNLERWEAEGAVDRDLFLKAGANGFLAFEVPEDFGGGGIADFRFNVILTEEMIRVNGMGAAAGLIVHNDVCVPYLLEATNERQRRRWLPGVCAGTTPVAIAMTEPTTGSDLAAIRTTAVRDGDEYIINGSKTFITSAHNCDLAIVACTVEPGSRHRGVTLIVVESDRDGFVRGRNLDKVGQHAADTGELFFTDVRVPARNRLGPEGSGFPLLTRNLARERVSIAVSAVAIAEAAFAQGLSYALGREAFGQPIGRFQNSRFILAELRTELDIAQVFVDRCVDELNAGTLSPVIAAEAKLWTTELCNRVVDRCLQLHGGYGYMEEYPIARMWRDARVTTIYGGTSEIMKEIVGRSLGL